MNTWKHAAKTFFVPGAILLIATVLWLHTGVLPASAPVIEFYYAVVFLAGALLAWRFHSTRVFFTVAAIFLAERSLVFFSQSQSILSGPAAHNAFAGISLLLPLSFLAFSFIAERGFTAPAVASRLLFILLVSVLVTVTTRPTQSSLARLVDPALLSRHWLSWTRIPELGLAVFSTSFLVFLARFLHSRKPLEAGFFWSLLAVYLALDSGAMGRVASAFLATSVLILVVSVTETSYFMAYHDELTALPARRAFNEVIAGLEHQYAIAIADVDHFKRFNDTYGHETGDDVLRMVAAQLAEVTGGGKAFRCGGEEFAIVFAGISAKDALEHLELLRETIEGNTFMVRSSLDRRSKPRGNDRRQSPPKPSRGPRPNGRPEEVSVTVSIGVAEAGTRHRTVEQVIQAADRALYRAKAGGRNRVEIDGFRRRRVASAQST